MARGALNDIAIATWYGLLIGGLYMKPYENNDATCFVEGRFFEYDFETDAFPGKSDMESLDAVSTFVEYLLAHAIRCGYSGEPTDVGSLASFVAEKSKNAGVNISRQTLVNWLTRGLPANTAGGRENVYRLCFAMEMNDGQAREFFLKAYLERPFNYKDINEAVYFYCFRNALPYADAQRIISRIESLRVVDNPYADNITEQIGERLSNLATEEELLNYISENRSGFAIQNQSATEKIEQLIESCKLVAPKEYAMNTNDDEEITVDNIDELLNVIYGYSARATANARPIYKKSISKSNFPELVKRNWPQREQFEQILRKRTASYDVIRRALIMLTFYDFAANATVNRSLEGGIFDEFADEMNTVLAECGYVQLYWRNPFDWMIGYCAMAPEPLGTLRDLIEEYYLSDPTVIGQIAE